MQTMSNRHYGLINTAYTPFLQVHVQEHSKWVVSFHTIQCVSVHSKEFWSAACNSKVPLACTLAVLEPVQSQGGYLDNENSVWGGKPLTEVGPSSQVEVGEKHHP